MPYISRSERKQYQEVLSVLAEIIPQDRMLRPGHMNYIVSLLIQKVYGTQLRYADHNEVVGVLNCIALEFYRRKTAPYEEVKIKEEGDLTDL
jgi:hypothetical protein